MFDCEVVFDACLVLPHITAPLCSATFPHTCDTCDSIAHVVSRSVSKTVCDICRQIHMQIDIQLTIFNRATAAASK